MPYNLRLRMQVIKNTEYLKLKRQLNVTAIKVYKILLLKERLRQARELIKKKRRLNDKICDVISEICILRDGGKKFDDDIVLDEINLNLGKKFEMVEEIFGFQNNFEFREVFKPIMANVLHPTFEIDKPLQHHTQLHNEREQRRPNLNFMPQRDNSKNFRERLHLTRKTDGRCDCFQEMNNETR